MSVHWPSDDIDASDDAWKTHEISEAVLRCYGHPDPAGSSTRVVPPPGHTESAGPKAHEGVIGAADQSSAGGYAQRPIGVATNRPNLHRFAEPGHYLIAWPKALYIGRTEMP